MLDLFFCQPEDKCSRDGIPVTPERSLLVEFLAEFIWCACEYTLDGLFWDDPNFGVICDARYELGGMFP